MNRKQNRNRPNRNLSAMMIWLISKFIARKILLNRQIRTYIQISLIFIIFPTVYITSNTLLADYPEINRPDWVWFVAVILPASIGLLTWDIYTTAQSDPVAKNLRSTKLCLYISILFTIATFVNLYKWLS